jgi:hypothetical protein
MSDPKYYDEHPFNLDERRKELKDYVYKLTSEKRE